MQNLRSLRVVLAVTLAVNFSWGYMFCFTPSLVGRLYGLPLTDDMHLFLSLSRGACFFFLAALSLLGLLRPRGFRVIALLLAVAYLFLFLVDVIMLSWGKMELMKLLPEMAYFLLISAALVRFYPARIETLSKM